MTRQEHNDYWSSDRKPKDGVFCNLFGYGEISQYDSRCASCYLGHSHHWDRHDANILAKRAADRKGK